MSEPQFPPMPVQLSQALDLPNIHLCDANEPKLVYVREETLQALRAVAAAAEQLIRANDAALAEFRPRPDIAWRDLKAAVAALPSGTEKSK